MTSLIPTNNLFSFAKAAESFESHKTFFNMHLDVHEVVRKDGKYCINMLNTFSSKLIDIVFRAFSSSFQTTRHKMSKIHKNLIF